MMVAQIVKQRIDSLEPGVVITMKDFDLKPKYQSALCRALNRMVEQGLLAVASKGKYYKPKQVLGMNITPSAYELCKDFITSNGTIIGYFTGAGEYANMGLTTQISGAIEIGTNTYRRPMVRNNTTIRFVRQLNPITDTTIPLLILLDALRDIRKIPACTPAECVAWMKWQVARLTDDQRKMIVDLSMKYPPFVRAVLGAIMEQKRMPVAQLRNSLNGTTTYKLGIDPIELSTAKNWNIV